MKHKQFEAIFNISSLYYYLKAHEFFTRTVTDQDVFSEFCSVLFCVCVMLFFDCCKADEESLKIMWDYEIQLNSIKHSQNS